MSAVLPAVPHVRNKIVDVVVHVPARAVAPLLELHYERMMFAAREYHVGMVVSAEEILIADVAAADRISSISRLDANPPFDWCPISWSRMVT
jgi:hypothetical protein